MTAVMMRDFKSGQPARKSPIRAGKDKVYSLVNEVTSKLNLVNEVTNKLNMDQTATRIN